uniref:DUF148 domain-containing protein n=1 Tax=Syphacia muris TaxID=451379 RepID=A0A0N5ARQ6_9BILA
MSFVALLLLKLLLIYLWSQTSAQNFSNLYIPSEHSDGKITIDFCNQLQNSDAAATVKAGNREPTFLAEANINSKKQFCSIILNTQLTKAEIQQKIQDWMKNQNNTVQEAFLSEINATTVLRSQIQHDVLNLTSSLSPEVKQLVGKINDISNNMTLTPNEERNQVKTLLDNTPDTTRSELWPKIMELDVMYHNQLVFPLSVFFASSTNVKN